MNRKAHSGGFTFLELVAVIAIIGILLAIALNRLLPYIDEAERVGVLTLEREVGIFGGLLGISRWRLRREPGGAAAKPYQQSQYSADRSTQNHNNNNWRDWWSMRRDRPAS